MLLEKLPNEFLKFDLEPEIGDAQAADGALMSHGKNHRNFVFNSRQYAYFWKALYLRK
jgi:hypothetical protein